MSALTNYAAEILKGENKMSKKFAVKILIGLIISVLILVVFMSPKYAIRTLIEFCVAGLLIYGFMHEDKVISFEQAVKRIVKGNFKRFVRKSVKAYEEYKNNFDLIGEPSPYEPYTQHPNCRHQVVPYFESKGETK